MVRSSGGGQWGVWGGEEQGGIEGRGVRTSF